MINKRVVQLSEKTRTSIFCFLLFILWSFSSYSQRALEIPEEAIYKRISIKEPNKEVLKILNELGVDLACGAVFIDNNLQLELSNSILFRLEERGIEYTILIQNMSSYYEKKAIEDLPKARKELKKLKKRSINKKTHGVLRNIGQLNNCEEIDWAVPNNFNLNPNNSPNSFGGCLTWDQVLQELDDMRALYPNLISKRLDASSTQKKTVEGRTIYYVRISDNPDIDEPSEPETLYQSLIHSRESASLMQLLYFMWYVLENYDSDPQIKNLVDNQALYFIPVFNPDGFVYNQTRSPNGGGMQRKNRNLRGSCGTFLNGVDLNRNSAYYWGNGGSSTNSCSDIYMGTSPFSERETQIMRDFFLEHDFKLALNHHSYKNAMLHGYAGTRILNPRPDEYSKYSHDMSYYNRYAYGPSTSISSLNSGNMNDWMLGGPAGNSANGTPTGTGSGKQTLAWTPENGTASEGGFWPSPSKFVSIAKRAVRMNFLAAYFSGKYARLHDLNQSEISSLSGDLTFAVENLGQTPSKFTVKVMPISSNIISTGNAVLLNETAVFNKQDAVVSYALKPDIKPNDIIKFKVVLSNDYPTGNVLNEMTIIKVYQPSLIFKDNPDVNGLANWTTSGGSWHVTSDSYSGISAITASLSKPYSNSQTKTLRLKNSMNLVGADKGIIQYYAKWDLERSFDYVQLEASVDGSNWTPLCGKLTKPGAPNENNTYSGKSSASKSFQPDWKHLYDGDTQGKWRLEEVIIDNESNSFFLNRSKVYLRFLFKTDGSNSQDSYYNANFEGFSFDDFTHITIMDAAGFNVNALKNNIVKLYPNPTSGKFRLDLKNLNAKSAIFYNIQGKKVITIPVEDINNQVFDINVQPGIYFMDIKLDTGKQTIKVLVE